MLLSVVIITRDVAGSWGRVCSPRRLAVKLLSLLTWRVSDNIPMPDPSFDPANSNPSCSNVRYRLYNIGNHQQVGPMEFFETMQNYKGKKANKNTKPMTARDMEIKYAETRGLPEYLSFEAATSITIELRRFFEWQSKFCFDYPKSGV